MAHHAFNVADLFAISGRGLVVASDRTKAQLGSRLALKIGDPVEFRWGSEVVLRSQVRGLEHFTPSSPEQPFCFLLPPEVQKTDVPIGSEVWIEECSLRRTE